MQPAQPIGRKRAAAGQPPQHQQHVDLALSVAQHSTASMGKFDATRFKETRRRAVDGKRSDDADMAREKESQLAMLSRMLGKDAAEGSASLDVDKAANVTKRDKERRGSGSGGGRDSTSREGGGGGGRGGRGGRGGSSRGGGRGGRGGRGGGSSQASRGARTSRGGRGGKRS